MPADIIFVLLRVGGWAALGTVLAFGLFVIWCRARFNGRRRYSRAAAGANSPIVVGFFHPFANSGGGGERVLWLAVKALNLLADEHSLNLDVLIYTGDTETDDEILQKTESRFGVSLSGNARPRFVRMRHRELIKPESWPRFTMLGQTIGSLHLAWQALSLETPDLYVDTTGFAFTLALAKICAGCRSAAYVHYPTISTDMLNMVSSGRASYNNRGGIASSRAMTLVKLLYYRAFAFAYGFVGSMTDVIMVNSTWTAGHIKDLWGRPARTHIVYPPCDTEGLAHLAEPGRPRERIVVSIAQFRPEKDQKRQIDALIHLRQEHSKRSQFQDVRLVMIGSCRNTGDHELANGLADYAKAKGVGEFVQICRNIPYAELQAWLGRAMLGIHTMWNEHFGIGVVEMQAAGCIPVAHNSAGPRFDIIQPFSGSATSATGFLCEEPEEYADAIVAFMQLPEEERSRMRRQAQESANQKFSETIFIRSFQSRLLNMLLQR